MDRSEHEKQSGFGQMFRSFRYFFLNILVEAESNETWTKQSFEDAYKWADHCERLNTCLLNGGDNYSLKKYIDELKSSNVRFRDCYNIIPKDYLDHFGLMLLVLLVQNRLVQADVSILVAQKAEALIGRDDAGSLMIRIEKQTIYNDEIKSMMPIGYLDLFGGLENLTHTDMQSNLSNEVYHKKLNVLLDHSEGLKAIILSIIECEKDNEKVIFNHSVTFLVELLTNTNTDTRWWKSVFELEVELITELFESCTVLRDLWLDQILSQHEYFTHNFDCKSFWSATATNCLFSTFDDFVMLLAKYISSEVMRKKVMERIVDVISSNGSLFWEHVYEAVLKSI